MKIDKKIIKELSDYLDEFNLTELEYTEKDTKIKVSKNNVSIKNQTASSSYKPAILDCGINTTVPPFIEAGDKIILDTRTLEYVKKTN